MNHIRKYGTQPETLCFLSPYLVQHKICQRTKCVNVKFKKLMGKDG